MTDETTLLIDPQLLTAILFNLLANASTYSGEDALVQLTSAVAQGQFTLQVTDQGIGIPQVSQHQVFTRFFRARNAIHIPGVGLGLYLVKRYVDLLAGSLTFSSEPGQGTTFTVLLPLAPTDPG